MTRYRARAVLLLFLGLVLVLTTQQQWTLGWIYIRLVVATMAINLVCVLCWNPEVIRRRVVPGKGTKTWDIVWISC